MAAASLHSFGQLMNPAHLNAAHYFAKDEMFVADNNLMGVSISADSMDNLVEMINSQFGWCKDALISRSTAYRALRKQTSGKHMWTFHRVAL